MRMPSDLPPRPRLPDHPVYAFAADAGALSQQIANWQCALCCAHKAGFGACLARCLLDGQACDGGTHNCSSC